MKIVVSNLSRTSPEGYICGTTVRFNFLLNGKPVHGETFKGKCLSKYVRTLPDFEFDSTEINTDESTTFVYSIE